MNAHKQLRAQALLGEAPVLTFTPDASAPDVAISVSLVRGDGGWLGLVPDRAAFTDRVRMGMTPRFVLCPRGDVPTVAGVADVRVLGRAEKLAGPAVATLVARAPFSAADCVVIEVAPRELAIDDGEDLAHGAIPRT